MNEPIYNNIYDDLFIEEKIDGKIYYMARPTGKHADVSGNIVTLFNNYFRKNKVKCLARFESRLNIDKDNYLVPDVMVFCSNYSRHIPLIAIEILSKSTRKKDLGVKKEKYAQVGIKEYWIVDPRHYTIDIYLLNDNGIYDLCESYDYYSDKEFSQNMKIREAEKSNLEITEEFSPVSIPEMKILLEDVFYFVEELTDGEE